MSFQARHAAREAALVILFAVDAGHVTSPEEALSQLGEGLRGDEEILGEMFADDPEDPREMTRILRLFQENQEHWDFVERLVRGVMNHLTAIDDILSRCSNNWKLRRMSRVDRNILRLAAYEMNFEEDVPIRATLNEAIEMAKRFGSEESGKFVNGILDRLAQELKKV